MVDMRHQDESGGGWSGTRRGRKIGEGRPATSLPWNRVACADAETPAWMIGLRRKRRIIAASTFQAILRPAACFLTIRTMVTIRSRMHKMSVIRPYTQEAMAVDSTSSQSVPEQMSEPWHLLKPARQGGRRRRVQAARIDGCSRAGVIYGCRVIDGVSALLTSLPSR